MDFSESEDHRLIREAVRDVCTRFDDDYWAGCESTHTFPWAFYDAMAAGGWVGIAVPESYGGGGQGIEAASIVLEEVAASGACMNGASAIHMSIFGMHPVVRHGSEAMRRRYLPRIATGDLHVAFGVTEPDAGLDTTAITTRAVRDGPVMTRSTGSPDARCGPRRRSSPRRSCCWCAPRRPRSARRAPRA